MLSFALVKANLASLSVSLIQLVHRFYFGQWLVWFKAHLQMLTGIKEE
jgi:hypothetical protein